MPYKNPIMQRACGQRYRASTWGRYSEKINGADRRYIEKIKCINAYGGKCLCCGESKWEFLAIDHIYGGGGAHLKSIKRSGCSFYVWLRKQGYPKDNYRLLCHNCNMSLGFFGYCPHGIIRSNNDIITENYNKKCRRKLRKKCIEMYGGQCKCCGISQIEFLSIDHINNDGYIHRKSIGTTSGIQFYLWLKRNNYPQENLRCLCFNCNCSLGFHGYCPHGNLPPLQNNVEKYGSDDELPPFKLSCD